MRRMLVATGAVAAICALGGLAGCGKLGSLERPGPMFGHPQAAAQTAPHQDPNRPVQTIDPRDQNSIPGQDQPSPLPPPAPRAP